MGGGVRLTMGNDGGSNNVGDGKKIEGGEKRLQRLAFQEDESTDSHPVKEPTLTLRTCRSKHILNTFFFFFSYKNDVFPTLCVL